MDGLTLIRKLRQVMGETSDTDWLDLKFSYDCLYDAAVATADATQVLTATQTITTQAGNPKYTLTSDFLKLYIQNERIQYFLRYYDTSSYTQLSFRPYNYVFLAQHTGTASVPSCFTIQGSIPFERYTGTTTDAGVVNSAGESTLTDINATFMQGPGATITPTLPTGYTGGAGWDVASKLNKSSDGVGLCYSTTELTPDVGRIYKVTIVSDSWSVGALSYSFGGVTGTAISSATTTTDYITPTSSSNLIFSPSTTGTRISINSITIKPYQTVRDGEFVHNATQNSTGITYSWSVSNAFASTALFSNDTGIPDGWASGDTYYIEPQGRYEIILDPPPQTAGHTITLPYVRRPKPVYTYYAVYPFPVNYQDALVAYAAWKYKYRNQEPNFGDSFYKMWDNSVRRLGANVRGVTGRTRMNVNLSPGGRRSGTNI